MGEFKFRTGHCALPDRWENTRIMRGNLQHGRPFTEGLALSDYVPDPHLPEWITVKIVDAEA
ncbi:hypothetical protein [Mesorhizobium temperatum]|nr:hypothetical protein [Mesorhizobium temperatum]